MDLRFPEHSATMREISDKRQTFQKDRKFLNVIRYNDLRDLNRINRQPSVDYIGVQDENRVSYLKVKRYSILLLLYR